MTRDFFEAQEGVGIEENSEKIGVAQKFEALKQRCFRVIVKVVCDRQVNRNAGICLENFAIFRSKKLKILFKDKNKNMTSQTCL